jgi:hypothetical protein
VSPPQLRAWLLAEGEMAAEALSLCQAEAARLSAWLPVVEVMSQREGCKRQLYELGRSAAQSGRLHSPRGTAKNGGSRHGNSKRLLGEEKARAHLYAQLREHNHVRPHHAPRAPSCARAARHSPRCP